MVPTTEDVNVAKRWLENQRAVVHPGPIETVRFALDILWAQCRDREDAIKNHAR